MKITPNNIIYGIGALGLIGFGTMQIGKLNHNVTAHEQKTQQIKDDKVAIGSGFDFYVLALTWSPTYCLTSDDKNNKQCNGNYGFIVHGLWPQYENGYPRECNSSIRNIDHKIIQKMMDIMPSERLIKIEWERHGTCSGLKPDEYYSTLRKAYERINIPQFSNDARIKIGDVENAFSSNNKGLSNDMIAVTTKNGNISDVRICMTKELQFRQCDEVNKNAARETYRVFIPKP